VPLIGVEGTLPLIERIARLTTEEETKGGIAGEDAVAALNDLIASARQITGLDPRYPKLYCNFCGSDVADCDCQDFTDCVLDAKTRKE
jgi:hypothetical protein